MDDVKYRVYNQQIGEWRYLIDQSVAYSFTSDLIKGTLTNYYVDGLFQQFSDYVVSLVYYPVDITKFANLGAVQTTMTLGKQNINYSNQPVTSQKASVLIAEFDLTRYFNNFLDFSPYTRYTLHVPFFDEIILPVYKESFTGTYYIYMSMDLTSGSATLYIEFEDSNQVTYVVDTKTAQIGIHVAIGKSNKEEQTRNNILQALSMIGSAVGLYMGVSSGNPLVTAGSVGLLTKNVTSAINNNVDRLTSYKASSGNRSSLSIDKTIYLSIERPSRVYDISPMLKGKPYKQNQLLSFLSGYTEIGKINFNPNGKDIYDDEINEIIDILRTGVIL